MKDTKRWLVFIVAATLMWIGLCRCCHGEFACEVSAVTARGRAVGSGFCVRVDDQYVYTATNAHVIRGRTRLPETRWSRGGIESVRLPAEVVYENDGELIDFAILRQSVKPFQGRTPWALKLPPVGFKLSKGAIVYTVGCPHGSSPTWLKCRVMGFEKHRPGILLSPRVEDGRSGSAVVSEDGLFLLAIVDSWARDWPQYGGALYHTAVRKELEKVCQHEPRLFDGSLCRNGLCGQRQQQQTPPGTGQAYPQLPPLAGVGKEDVPPLPPAPMVDEQARQEIISLGEKLAMLETRLAELGVVVDASVANASSASEKASDAKSAAEVAKAKAEDASKGVGVLTGTILDLPATMADTAEAAVEAGTAEMKEEVGLIGRLKGRVDGVTDAIGEKAEKIHSRVEGLSEKLSPWALAKRFGWMPSLLVIGLLALWGRVEWKRRTGQEFRTTTGEVLSKGTGAVHGAAEAGKDFFFDRLRGLGSRGRVLGRLFDRLGKAEEDEEDERELGRLRSVLGGGEK